MNNTNVVVLPIGEFDTDIVKNEFDAMISVLTHSNADIVIAEAESTEEGARRSVQVISEKKPDILIIITLRGLSAQAIETSGSQSRVPVMIWPVQGRFALPSSVLAIGALQESNVPVELLYIPPNHPDVSQRLLPILKAAKAYSRLKKSRIGVVGSLFPNLVSCRYDAQTIRTRLGTVLVPITFDEIRNSIHSMDNSTSAFEQMRKEIGTSYKVNTSDQNSLKAGVKLHLALKRKAIEQDLEGFATECWTAFPRELGLNPCLGFIEDAYSLACEGDVMLCISLLIIRYMTGVNAYVGDLFDLDMDGILTLTHCGAPASNASSEDTVVLGRSQLALERGFETLTCRPQLELGPVTIFRFYGKECDKLHLASGELITCETSPNLTVKVKINADRMDFLNQCQGNHYLLVHGDLRTELKQLYKWLGVTIFET